MAYVYAFGFFPGVVDGALLPETTTQHIITLKEKKSKVIEKKLFRKNFHLSDGLLMDPSSILFFLRNKN